MPKMARMTPLGFDLDEHLDDTPEPDPEPEPPVRSHGRHLDWAYDPGAAEWMA